MLKDSIKTYNNPAFKEDLDVKPNWEVMLILSFIDKTIPQFQQYYFEHQDSNKENRISDFLVYHFNSYLRDEEFQGFPSFLFGKNPTQEISDQETDIGVVVLTKGAKPVTIIEFEAKRFSNTSNNSQYVYGNNRGGIERFKLEEHGNHLCIAGMFGYVQHQTIIHWIEKINTWIDNKSKVELEIASWKNDTEKLKQLQVFETVEKWESIHQRNTKEPIKLYHYFIDIVIKKN